MNYITKIFVTKRILLISVLSFVSIFLNGQQTPLNPISYWVFNQYIYNPAIAGSKDFLSIGINTSFQGYSNTQFIGGNARISKAKSGYFSSPDIIEFKNLGIGGSIFRDVNGLSQNIGISAAGSYQIPMTTRQLSFLSFGVSVKGVFNTLDSDPDEPQRMIQKAFYPNLDLGLYYYGTNLFAGLSGTNVLGNPGKADSSGLFDIPVSRQYFFTAGYKILLSKSLNIVLEPSVLLITCDSTFRDVADNLNPIIRLYLDNFCLGTSFHPDGKISFFSQFRYPRFYIGALYEVAKKTAYYKKNPLVEFTFGVNIQPDKSRLSKHSQW